MSSHSTKIGKDSFHRLEVFVPNTREEQQSVQNELERVLASSYFQNSRRCSNLLRYVVDQALRGNTDFKERTLGIEVFGRPATYDLNSDTTVRVAAGDIRKRLAQYYHEVEHEPEVQIDLPTGAYVPEFRRIAAERSADNLQPIATALPSPQPSATSTAQPRPTKPGWVMVLALVLLGVLLGWLVGRGSSQNNSAAAKEQTAFENFWKPLVQSPGTAVICLGDMQTFQQEHPEITSAVPSNPPAEPAVSFYLASRDHVTLPLAVVAAHAATVLQGRGKDYRITSSSGTNLADLRQGPIVLVGLFNNRWTARLTEGLRFYPKIDGPAGYILDRQNPTKTDWKLGFNMEYSKVARDYGLVVRLHDPMTDRPIIIAAGLASQGSLAAGEFISTPEFLNATLKDAPKDWQKMNFEAVIQTDVIDGKTGAPHVVAVHYW